MPMIQSSPRRARHHNVQRLSLRLRVFLFFCVLGFGGVAVAGVGLWVGYQRFGDAATRAGFILAGVIACFGILALATFFWWLFDETVSKPIEHLAAQMRIRANADISPPVDAQIGRHLGDLAAAATAFHARLDGLERGVADAVAQRTARLKTERGQLLRILSDIPVAVIVATAQHKIVLYDGQAADLMENEAPARLHGSVFDYLDQGTVERSLASMKENGKDRETITVKGVSDTQYSGHLRLFPDEAGYTLMLEPLKPGEARPLVYDFDLFAHDTSAKIDDIPLHALSFVVFDSETTGLDPAKDQVVQLGAVRVVNGKLIAGETFDTLVKPTIPIPASATKIHHIDNRMVKDAPDFADAHARLHGFTSDAVIVAHNAPFDMAFLQRQSKASALEFDNPVLDTVHLSAIVFGGSATHTLDAISLRLGITIPDDMRHTALGDAIATAEVLVAMLPILEARGFTTLAELRPEIRKHRRILEEVQR